MPLREWWRGLHAPRLGEAPWSPARRVLFRVLFVFVLLFLSLPAPLNLAPGLSGFTNPIWTSFALRLGAVLGLQVPIHGDTGSSDGMRDWLILASVLVVSIAVAAVWSAVQRAPTRHGKLLDFLELYCRVSLVQMLAVYGAIKVLALQFPLPDAATLLLSYGESSPMKLMWTFMGASPTYQRFGGWMRCGRMMHRAKNFAASLNGNWRRNITPCRVKFRRVKPISRGIWWCRGRCCAAGARAVWW